MPRRMTRAAALSGLSSRPIASSGCFGGARSTPRGGSVSLRRRLAGTVADDVPTAPKWRRRDDGLSRRSALGPRRGGAISWGIAVAWPLVHPVGAPPGPFGKRAFSARDQPAPMAREALDTTYATASPANSKEPRFNDVCGPNGIRSPLDTPSTRNPNTGRLITSAPA
jgi:hypothetical protein